MNEALRLSDALRESHPYPLDIRQAADELRRLHRHELSNEVWNVKTQWVQDTAKPKELGMHRADVMRQRLVRAEAQRDALLEALKDIGKYTGEGSMYTTPWQDIVRSIGEKARAAIAAVEGEKE